MKSKIVGFGVLALFVMSSKVLACGPFFDEAYLVRGSEKEFLSMPEGSFKYELEKISGNTKLPQIKEDAEYFALRAKTASADVDDLKEAMKSSGSPELQKQEAIKAYEERRTSITEYLNTNTTTNPGKWFGDQFRSTEKKANSLKIAEDRKSESLRLIPEEFILYMDGAVAYHNEDFQAAIKKWQELLKLPKEKRKYRSVWASFMIGKAYLYMHKNKESIPYFEMSRKLMNEGYRDSLNLAQESYGWQALAELELGQYAACIKHYLPQVDTVSLNQVCKKIADLSDAEFESVANDDIARRVLIGWVVSHVSYYSYSNDENTDYIQIATRLLKVIEKNKLSTPLESADRIAWMFYNLGDFQKADKWLKTSKEKSALSQWLRVKLLVRDGELDKAIEKMSSLKYVFEKNAEWRMFGTEDKNDTERILNTEMSVLLLHRKDYIMAFDILLKGAYWEDVAYVAEKVLTADELEKYLKDHKISDATPFPDFFYTSNLKEPVNLRKALEYLLARRYAREGNKEKALQYMPTYLKIDIYPYAEIQEKSKSFNPREKLQQLYAFLNKAEDTKLMNKQRAESYYNAALIVRGYGMELMGTELDPDWFVFNGQFDVDRTPETRFAVTTQEREDYYKGWYDEKIKELKDQRQKILKGRTIFYGSKEEESRVLDSMPEPYKRFHYRYKAAELMWKCAELLPNDDGLKAKALCLGGTYLKNRDKNEANKFYKELIKTCNKTELGKAAAKLKWFPKMKEG